ncbi:hypothetical protein F4679DRAFT_580847 [Xylaria curta]|nr:hypothetical protein F4679DRAFT_580847 [Xylaria curta]
MREPGKIKRRVKHRVDYRHRWPTQQTLIESRVSMDGPRSKRPWKSGVELLRRLKRRSSPEPGKSTHPYDTGVGEQGSGSGPSSSSNPTDDGLGCWKRVTHMPPNTPPLPAPPSPVYRNSLTSGTKRVTFSSITNCDAFRLRQSDCQVYQVQNTNASSTADGEPTGNKQPENAVEQI